MKLTALLVALLLSASASAATPFADNPIVYFLITDRFANGNPANDNSYGRKRESAPQADVGTFHGGDLKGITDKLDAGWFTQLGVNAIWITAPYEQIHGWVVGGDKAFKHYAYHGYYALDYTRLDANMGTPDELREMVDTAHKHGIRVLFDVVMNHPGYLDIQTAIDLKIPVLWPKAETATLADYHSFIDYNSSGFKAWWGRPWVRAGLPGYIDGGSDDLTKQLAYLPDFRTESKEAVTLPTFLRNKPDTKAVDLPDMTVRGYLVKWLTDWVREYGIDGFRADTVKHVEPAAWLELKSQATAALADWKARHPTQKIDDTPFWMTGEFWGHGPERDAVMEKAGFDAMINFDFQGRAADPSRLDALFASYAALQAGHAAQMLNYISSHDTSLYPRPRLIAGANALLLAPGGVQIFYGDETARPAGPAPSGDALQATRSDMNWAAPDEAVLAHWRKLGSFRARHVALARGVHARLADKPYAFSRIDEGRGDRVVVALDVPAGARVPVGAVFAEGDELIDAYSGHRVVVKAGAALIDSAAPAVLLERAAAVP